MYIPDFIREKAGCIRRTAVSSHAIKFNPEKWRLQIPDLDAITKGLTDNSISREYLLNIGFCNSNLPAHCSAQQQAAMRRFFILVMIWGYGGVGTGPWRVARMIQSPNFSKILCQVCHECSHGFFLKAYETLTANISRLGPAFASKFLYFYCGNMKANVKPLIFDSVVIKSLRERGVPRVLMDYLAHSANNPRGGEEAYGQYLILMHNWAKAIRCQPDQLEYFLWNLRSAAKKADYPFRLGKSQSRKTKPKL
jgi:hypothetical protein